MNRAQRRATGAPREAVYNLTQSQINQIKRDATNEAIDTAYILMLGIPAMIIHDKYPQLTRLNVDGKSREERFIDLCLDLYDSFERGYLTLDDMLVTLKEECNLVIKRGVKK